MGAPIVDFEELSTAEKILRLQEQWDRIAEDPEAVEVTDAQRRELDVRLAAMESNPDDVVKWSALKAEIRARR
jgi:putative addiction module component (TIGR02574 family)